MLYEFALLPDVIEESLTIPHTYGPSLLLSLLKGIRENGMLVNLRNGEWMYHVYEMVTGVYDGYGDEIRSVLDDLHDKNRIVDHPSNPDPGDWLDEAGFSKSQCDVYGIFLRDRDYSRISSPPAYFIPFPYPPSPSFVWSGWQGKRSKRLRKCDADFRDALTPVLRHASRVDLVDPFFNCHQEVYKKTLRLCIDLLLQGTARHPQLVIHAGNPQNDKANPNPDSPGDRINAWKVYLATLRPARRITFRVFLWGEMRSEKPHNRYIFTDQRTGISVPYGLACYSSSHASQDTWTLIDVDETQSLLRDYTSVPIYNKLEEVIVPR